MGHRIVIGKDDTGNVHIDIDKLVDTRMLVQANSGGGKTFAVRGLLERVGKMVPVTIIDPEGEFFTIREVLDVVLVRKGGDVEPTIGNAGALATHLLSSGVSAVIDLLEMDGMHRTEFVRRFFETTMAAPQKYWSPRLFVIDEAHKFAPEKGEAASLGVVNSLMTAGRKRGFCGILATQRLSSLSKTASAECNNNMIGRCTLDIDQKRAGDALGISKDAARALRSLEPGTFHAFGPAFDRDGVFVMKVGDVQSSHGREALRKAVVVAPSSKLAAKIPELVALSKPDPNRVDDIDQARQRIKELTAAMAQMQKVAERAKTAVAPPVVDEKAAARAVGAAKREVVNAIDSALKAARRTLVDAAKINSAIGVTVASQASSLAALRESLDAMVAIQENAYRDHAVTLRSPQQAAGIAARPATPTQTDGTPPPMNRAVREPGGASEEFNAMPGPHQRILSALAFWASVGVDSPFLAQVAFVAGYTVNGSFEAYVGRLGAAGLSERKSGMVRLTDRGAAVTPQAVTMSLHEYHEKIYSLLAGPEAKILKALIQADGETKRRTPVSLEDLADLSGYTVNGSFEAYVGRLGAKKLTIRSRGTVQLTAIVMPRELD